LFSVDIDKKFAYGSSGIIAFGIVFLVFFNSASVSDDSVIVTSPESRSFDMMGNIPPDSKILKVKDSPIGYKYRTQAYNANPPLNQWNEGYTFIHRPGPSVVERNVIFEEYDTPPTPPQRILDKMAAKIASSSHIYPPNLPIDPNNYTPPPPEAFNIDEYWDDVPLSTQSLPKSSPSPRIITTDVDIVQTAGTFLESGSLVSEPSVGQNSDQVFVTWNWGTAKSINGGTSFTFINPFSDFNMCCDQDVIYSPVHDIFIWYRQGDFDTPLGPLGCTETIIADEFAIPDPILQIPELCRNESRIGIATSSGFSQNPVSWCFFNIKSEDIDALLTNHWIDYPHVQVSNNKLFISTNVFERDGFLDFAGSAMLRFDLAGLVNCSNTSFDAFFTAFRAGFTAVSGATDTMYFGTQLGIPPSFTELYRVFDSVPGIPTVSFSLVSYAPYNAGTQICVLTSTGTNPCQRSDDRIQGGYVANGIIGFLLAAAQDGATFSWPYLFHIRINESTGALINNPSIFSNSFALQYPHAAANQDGDIAIGFYEMGGSLNPRYVVAVDESGNPGSGTGWEFKVVKTSDSGTIANVWGDYNRVRSAHPFDGSWVGSGNTMQGGPSDFDSEIIYVKFTTPQCAPPGSGPWNVLSTCTMTGSATAGGNVIVPSGVVLTIPNTVTLTINFAANSLTVESGGGVLIEAGGKII